jgi:hypothetical protein
VESARRDPDAGIGDLEHRVLAFDFQRCAPPPGGEAHRVVDEVVEDRVQFGLADERTSVASVSSRPGAGGLKPSQ